MANKVNNTLDIIDLKTGKLLEQVKGQQGIQGVAYAPDLDRVFVGLAIRGFCNIFDGEKYKLLKSIKFEDDADNVRYHEPTHRVYVAHAEKSLGIVDAQSYELKADVKLPNSAEGFVNETKRPRLYVCIPQQPSEITVIDLGKNEIIQHYPVKMAESGHPIALDEANHRLFVGCRTPAAVVVMDTETGREITAIPIAKEVDDLFYDAGRKQLYASCGEGFLSTIKQLDANRYEAGDKIATAKGGADVAPRRGKRPPLPGSAAAGGQGRAGDSGLSDQVRHRATTTWIMTQRCHHTNPKRQRGNTPALADASGWCPLAGCPPRSRKRPACLL